MVILREKTEMKKGALLSGVADGKPESTDRVLSGEKISKIGFAVDLGTTTVVLAGFVFFEEGESPLCIGKKSVLNAQTSLGKDVMMRIMHALSGKQKELQRMIAGQIENLAKEILESVGLFERAVMMGGKTEFVIVGNTTMSHLFLGESVEGLKGTPFRMAYQGNRCVSGEEIGFLEFRKAVFFVLSGISSHVGGDALSVLCKTEMKQSEKVLLAIDLGTNAEILLNDHGRLWCCSAAAGPAFEGRGVSGGRLAGPGVVCGVRFAVHTGNVILEYISGKEIYGICGSGLIDLLAELRRTGLVREDGYLLSRQETESSTDLKKWSGTMTEDSAGDRAFLIYEGKEKLLLTQKDIRNLQLAKGAIGAAVSMLFQETGLDLEKLDGVILTGVLGSSIRMESAMRLGLIPRVDREKVIFAGNAALDGAISLLERKELRERWEQQAKEVFHLELADREEFSTLFMKSVGMDSIF